MALTTKMRRNIGFPAVTLFVWALCFPSGPAIACTPLSEALNVAICAEGSSWELRKDQGDDFLFYNPSDDFAASIKIYDGGTSNGLDSARAARIMARSDREEAADFVLLKSGKVPSGNFVYAARGFVNDRSNIYVNTVSVGSTKTLRITTWRVGDTLSESDREIHLVFGKLIKVEP